MSEHSELSMPAVGSHNYWARLLRLIFYFHYGRTDGWPTWVDVFIYRAAEELAAH